MAFTRNKWISRLDNAAVGTNKGVRLTHKKHFEVTFYIELTPDVLFSIIDNFLCSTSQLLNFMHLLIKIIRLFFTHLRFFVSPSFTWWCWRYENFLCWKLEITRKGQVEIGRCRTINSEAEKKVKKNFSRGGKTLLIFLNFDLDWYAGIKLTSGIFFFGTNLRWDKIQILKDLIESQ